MRPQLKVTIIAYLFWVMTATCLYADPDEHENARTDGAGPTQLMEKAVPTKADERIELDLLITYSDRYLGFYVGLFGDMQAAFPNVLKARIRFMPEECGPADQNCSNEIMKIGLCLQNRDYELFRQFCVCQAEQIIGTPTSHCLEQIGLSAAELQACLKSGLVPAELAENQALRQAYPDQNLPLVLLNGEPFKERQTRIELERAICRLVTGPLSYESCRELPACLSHAECQQPGLLGMCEHAGTPEAHCIYKEPIAVPLTLIIPEPGYFTNQVEIMDLNYRNFPGIQLRELTENSPEAQALIKKYEITVLPAYLFGESIEQTYRFSTFRDGFYRKHDLLLFSPDRVGATVFCRRPREEKTLQLVLNSYSKPALELLLDLLTQPISIRDAIKLKVNYSFRYDQNGWKADETTRAADEESLRQMIIAHEFPQQFPCYLEAWLNNFGTTYWTDLCYRCSLDPWRVRDLATGPKGRELLQETIRAQQLLPLKPVRTILLIENREIVRTDTPFNPEKLLQQMLRQ
ncbi:hypothetical protein JXQ70_15870 [bacterium]|nr:hypothetical protein [bacterium]